ncbi:hypothetical protein PM082_004459 [Marasmius tenuissimus]|nr:hypothetical protein PM082_004459 [Marasmius tenuissimus]
MPPFEYDSSEGAFILDEFCYADFDSEGGLWFKSDFGASWNGVWRNLLDYHSSFAGAMFVDVGRQDAAYHVDQHLRWTGLKHHNDAAQQRRGLLAIIHRLLDSDKDKDKDKDERSGPQPPPIIPCPIPTLQLTPFSTTRSNLKLVNVDYQRLRGWLPLSTTSGSTSGATKYSDERHTAK